MVENARYDPINSRWVRPFLFNDPYEWTDLSGVTRRDIGNVHVPSSDIWEWLGKWEVAYDTMAGESVDEGGWEYASSFTHFTPVSVRRGERSMDTVRRRRWTRTRVPRHRVHLPEGIPLASSNDNRDSIDSRDSIIRPLHSPISIISGKNNNKNSNNNNDDTSNSSSSNSNSNNRSSSSSSSSSSSGDDIRSKPSPLIVQPIILFWDVKSLPNGNKRVELRSGFQLHNHLSFPVVIALRHNSRDDQVILGPIAAGDVHTVPLQYAHATWFRVKPDFPFHQWSSYHFCHIQSRDFESVKDVTCEAMTDTNASATFRLVSKQVNKSMLIHLVPYISITNKLLCDVEYCCFSLDRKREDGVILSGKDIKLSYINLSYQPKISFKVGAYEWSAPSLIQISKAEDGKDRDGGREKGGKSKEKETKGHRETVVLDRLSPKDGVGEVGGIGGAGKTLFPIAGASDLFGISSAGMGVKDDRRGSPTRELYLTVHTTISANYSIDVSIFSKAVMLDRSGLQIFVSSKANASHDVVR